MIDLRNKIILITGATSGIGEACAYAFGKSGAKIALTGRNGDRLSALASNLNNYGTDCFFYKCVYNTVLPQVLNHPKIISFLSK